MTDKVLCPFCGQKIMCMDAQDADNNSTWYCPRCIAERNWYAFGNETLWQELIRTRKELEQSETCCPDWEKQALAYKAENINLSDKIGKLEPELDRTRKALDVALCSLQNIAESNGDFITGASTPLDEHEYADMMLKEIKRQMKIKTALEQKEE